MSIDIAGEITRNSPVPYYYQLKQLLLQWIEGSRFTPHTQLPTESELKKRFGISRTVIRQALLELEQEGRIYREKGRGSFIAPAKLRQQISELTSFTEDMRAHGTRPGAQVLRREIIRAGEIVAQRLQVPTGAAVFCLERIRLADNRPLALETAYLHVEHLENLVDVDFENQSLYQALTVRFGISAFWAEQELEAAIVRVREAKLLNLPHGAPVMLIRRTTYNDQHIPIEFVQSIYRGDKYCFVARLQRELSQ